MERDIIVTTPAARHHEAAKEAEDAKRAWAERHERTYYFRRLAREPRDFGAGSRVYYVERGYVRGFCTVERDLDIQWTGDQECSSSGRLFGSGTYVYMPADSWQWIAPIPHAGFQGWRYAPEEWRELEVVGGWLDPMPFDEPAFPAPENPSAP